MASAAVDFLDFEFLRLDHSVAMLPADQLFSDGKLLPTITTTTTTSLPQPKILPPLTDPSAFSPRAPTCTGRWRHLLPFRRSPKSKSPTPNPNPRPTNSKHRIARSLLSDPPETAPTAARLSLSVADHDDLPRFSLDDHHLPRVRPVPSPDAAQSRPARSPIRRSPESAPAPARGASVDSPRMSASGKIVFQGLERSSSHPGSVKPPGLSARSRGMDRPFSANVRVTPVLNVPPICSLGGSAAKSALGQIFSSSSGSAHKRDGPASTGTGSARTAIRHKTDRV